ALIIAVLSVLGATLTLPGIAGIVLTMGMAVDSNVIIFERVREENRQGRSIVQSMDSGFKQALATVVDANVTTLIAAVILFFLGSGPIKGFAVTLAIGIVTTVFTAFTLTRWLVAFWLRRQRPKTMPAGVMRLSIASAVLFFTVGMNYGIDFRGGSSIEVQAKGQQADIGDIRERLTGLELGEVQVQEFGSARDVLIRIGTQGGGDVAEQ
ncbi:MAG: protein translocase subunit SecDF, partial [Mesorhizobium sp.]